MLGLELFADARGEVPEQLGIYLGLATGGTADD